VSNKEEPKQLPRKLRQSLHWVRRPATKAPALIALVGVVGVIAIQLSPGSPNGTTLALLFFAIALIFGMLAPRQTGFLVERVTNFKVAGLVEIGLGSVARAESVKPPGVEGKDEERPVERTKSEGIAEVVEKLRKNLQFIHAITDLRHEIEDEDAYCEIAHTLAATHLLDKDEAQFVLDLISERDLGVSALPPAQRDEFLDAAWSFAFRFRFMVWDRYVREELTSRGWIISDFRQSLGHRRDFLGCWEGDWVLMAARVGGKKNPHPYPVTRDRLSKTTFKAPLKGRCIVIPGVDRQATVVGKSGSGVDSNVKVLELQGSLREQPRLAFEADPCNQDAQRRAGDCQTAVETAGTIT
jgi:hypothetical protein